MKRTYTGTASSLGRDREITSKLALRGAQQQAAAHGEALDDDYVLSNHTFTIERDQDGNETITATITT